MEISKWTGSSCSLGGYFATILHSHLCRDHCHAKHQEERVLSKFRTKKTNLLWIFGSFCDYFQHIVITNQYSLTNLAKIFIQSLTPASYFLFRPTLKSIGLKSYFFSRKWTVFTINHLIINFSWKVHQSPITISSVIFRAQLTVILVFFFHLLRIMAEDSPECFLYTLR
jgi:hypothetical protein